MKYVRRTRARHPEEPLRSAQKPLSFAAPTGKRTLIITLERIYLIALALAAAIFTGPSICE